jgi:hypothetical protein|tara:strand:- start:7 stop:567 length:561 start_codon:yes stop_codon:yes gene_type:complete
MLLNWVKENNMIGKTLTLTFACTALCLVPVPAFAVLIGDYPGLEVLIEKADAIVIARVDHHVDARSNPTLYTTHDCYIYQTLKGRIPSGRTTRLRLMDTRTSFVTPFAMHSIHIVFLTKKRSPDEPTDYRSIAMKGANIRLSPFGQERKLEGKTVAQQITGLLKGTIEYNQKQHEKEQAFLTRALK